MEVVSKVAVHGSREASDQSVKQFEAAEVELDPEPSTVQLLLPSGHEFFHGLEWPDEEPSFPLDVHILFKLSGDIPGIKDDDAVDVLVDRSADITVIRGRESENDPEDSPIMIAGHRHFEAVKPAL